MKKLTQKQKIEIAEVMLWKATFMASMKRILRDCRITKEQARECLNFYLNLKREKTKETK